MNLLNDVVHRFVLVEASITFTSNDKCFFFEKFKEDFKTFLDKIIHIKFEKESFPYPNPTKNTNQQWENEYFQRNALCNGLYDITEQDIVLLSDVDEIYDPRVLTYLKSNIKNDTLYIFEQKMFYYNLTCQHIHNWLFPNAFTYGMWTTTMNKTPFSMIRKFANFKKQKISPGGWHLSYFGTVDFIINKIKNFSHHEFNNEEILNCERIETCINNNMDLFQREDVPLRLISISDNNYLPLHYDIFLSDFI